ncbi:unnamed protein product [Diabrotica balteata]|uniref:Uncharacterized protein n=1 Tax=Diabrotica balteata TaxID=107213 RepID=A0A9P0E0V0_DIABA|nr:unnamed protein product [Diabrotica balteata]
MDTEENIEIPISDIYDDFDNFDLGETVEKLKEENEKLKKQIIEQNEDMAKLLKALNDMKTTNDNLRNNISSLLLTAKAELGRKDNTIADLRRDLDNIAFRRYRENFQKYNGCSKAISQNEEQLLSTCGNNKENKETTLKIEKLPLVKSKNVYQHSVETSNNLQTNTEQSLDKLHSSRYNNYQERVLNTNKETREIEYLDHPQPLFVKDYNSEIYVKQENKNRNKIFDSTIQKQSEYDNLERNQNHVDKRCYDINQYENIERNYKLEDVDRHKRHTNKNNLTNQQDNHEDSRWNNKKTRDRSRYRNDEDIDLRRGRNDYKRNSNRFDGRSKDLRYEGRRREESDEQFSRRRSDYRKDGKSQSIYGRDRSQHRLSRFPERKRNSLDRYKTQDDLDDYIKDKSRTGKKLLNVGGKVKDQRKSCYSAALGENFDIIASEEGEIYGTEEYNDENEKKECKMDETNTDLKITINNKNTRPYDFFNKELGNILDGIQSDIRIKNGTTTLECNHQTETIETVVEPRCATKTKADLLSQVLQKKAAEIFSPTKLDKKKKDKSRKQVKLKIEDIFGQSSVDEFPENNVQENIPSIEKKCATKQKVLLNNIFGDESNDIFKEDDDFRNFRMLVEADNVDHTTPKKMMKCAKLEIKERLEGGTGKEEKRLPSYDISTKKKRSSDNDNKTTRKTKEEHSEDVKSDVFLLTKKQSNELDSYHENDDQIEEIKKKYNTKKRNNGGDEVNINKQHKSKILTDKYYEEPPSLISDFEYTFVGEPKDSKPSVLEQEKSTENLETVSGKQKKVNQGKNLTKSSRRDEVDMSVTQNGSNLKDSKPLTRKDEKSNEKVDTALDQTKKVSQRRKSTKSNCRYENDDPTTQNESDFKNSKTLTIETVDKSSGNSNTASDKTKNISQRRRSTTSNSRHDNDISTEQNKSDLTNSKPLPANKSERSGENVYISSDQTKKITQRRKSKSSRRCDNDFSETPNVERDLNNSKPLTSVQYTLCSKNSNTHLEKKKKPHKRRKSTRSNSRHDTDISITPDESDDGIKIISKSLKTVKNKLSTDTGKTDVSSIEKKAIRSKMSDEINTSTIINEKRFAEPPPILSDFEYTILEDLNKSQSVKSPTKLKVNTKSELPTNIIRTFENTEEHKNLIHSHSSKSELLKEIEVKKLAEKNSGKISAMKAQKVGANAKTTRNYSESHTDAVTVPKILEACISEELKESFSPLDNKNFESSKKVVIVSDIMVSPSKKKNFNNFVSHDKTIQGVLDVPTTENVNNITSCDEVASKQEERRGLTTEVCLSTECVKPKSLSRKNLLLERYASQEVNNKNLDTSTTVSCVTVNENNVQAKNDNGIHNKRKQIDESIYINPPKKKKNYNAPVNSIDDRKNDETSSKNRITKSGADQELFETAKVVKPVKQPAQRSGSSREHSSEPDQVLKDTAISEKDSFTPKKNIKKEVASKYNEEITAATKAICELENKNNVSVIKCREDNIDVTCSTTSEQTKKQKDLSDLDISAIYDNKIAPTEQNIIIQSTQQKSTVDSQPESKENVISSSSTIKNPHNSSTCSTESPKPRKRITPIPVKDVPVCTFTNILNKSDNLPKQLPKKVVMNTHLPEDTDIPILHLEELSFSNLGEGKTLDKSIMKFLDGFSVSNLDCDVSRVSNESQKKEPLTFTNVLEKINSPCRNIADFTSPDQHVPQVTTSTPKSVELSALKSGQTEKTPTSVTKTDTDVLSPELQEHQNKDVSSNKNNKAENVKNVPFTNLNTPARFRRRCRIIAVRKL